MDKLETFSGLFQTKKLTKGTEVVLLNNVAGVLEVRLSALVVALRQPAYTTLIRSPPIQISEARIPIPSRPIACGVLRLRVAPPPLPSCTCGAPWWYFWEIEFPVTRTHAHAGARRADRRGFVRQRHAGAQDPEHRAVPRPLRDLPRVRASDRDGAGRVGGGRQGAAAGGWWWVGGGAGAALQNK
jgi:hypothetical protein